MAMSSNGVNNVNHLKNTVLHRPMAVKTMTMTNNDDDHDRQDSTDQWPMEVLLRKARNLKLDISSKDFASVLDDEDPLSSFRSLFEIPKLKDLPDVDVRLVESECDECLYFNGGSMGLKPKSATKYMTKQLELWATWASFAYMCGTKPIVECDQQGRDTTAKLIGAKFSEVALMNALTVNLHLLLVSFYRPDAKRNKILMESMAFSSDVFAIKSQIRFHDYDPEECLLTVEPRKGEKTLRTQDILDYIDEHGDSIAVVLFSGVHFYTGQKFDMEAIVKAGHKKGCFVGFDLAHAIGNVTLELHKWNVDFATWCSYKYLNSGPGGLAGIFVHQKHDERKLLNFDGWWGNKLETRFSWKESELDESIGAERFKISNTPPWLTCLNRASLDIFEMTSMDELTDKQFLLTGYLELLVHHYWPLRTKLFENTAENENNLLMSALILDHGAFKKQSASSVHIITPADPKQRGNQMSLFLDADISADDVHRQLHIRGIACDVRHPGVIRVALAPLYNSFRDVFLFVRHLRAILDTVRSNIQ